MRAAAVGAALLLALAGPAQAQEDWRAAAPALAIEGQVRPLAAPLTLGGTAWGPWRSLCREQATRPGRPPARDCLAVAQAQPEPGGTRIVLLQERAGLRIGALRTAEGRIAEFAAVLPDGAPAPPEPARDGLLAAWREQFATLSLERRRVAPGQDFPLPAARGGTCRPEGTAALGGRPVLVARCAVELAGRLRGGESDARVAIFARVAIDIATGMVAQQGYATRIETFGGGRSNGVVVTPSRVLLE